MARSRPRAIAMLIERHGESVRQGQLVRFPFGFDAVPEALGSSVIPAMVADAVTTPCARGDAVETDNDLRHRYQPRRAGSNEQPRHPLRACRTATANGLAPGADSWTRRRAISSSVTRRRCSAAETVIVSPPPASGRDSIGRSTPALITTARYLTSRANGFTRIKSVYRSAPPENASGASTSGDSEHQDSGWSPALAAPLSNPPREPDRPSARANAGTVDQ